MTSPTARYSLRPAACLAALCLAWSPRAGADFVYSADPSAALAGGSPGGSDVITLSATSRAAALTAPAFIRIASVLDRTTADPAATDAFTLDFTDAVTLYAVTPSGDSGHATVTVAGLLRFTRSDVGGEASLFAASSPSFSADSGGVTYTLSDFVYDPPAVNSDPGGDILALVTAAPAPRAPLALVPPVPEPASAVLLAFGLAAVGFAAAHRAG